MVLPNDFYDLNTPAGILLRVLLFAAITIIAARVIETFLDRYLRQAAIRLRVSATKYIALRRLVIAAVYVTGLIIIIESTPQLQSLSIAIFASVSIVGIVIGIAAQSTISNIIAGVAIVISKPFGVGDFVTVRGESGFVEDITFRHTVIRLLDAHMIIPNSSITSDVVFNHSDSTIAARIDVRISYDSDLRLAKQIIRHEAEKAVAINQQTIEVIVSKTDEQGVTFSLIFRLEESPFNCVSDLREAIVLRLLSEHVTIS
ncbi:MAG: mechanosensitive ion channel domain-containing protein [Halobacteriota archaeon]|jgi:small conductance mechanosensitive channel